MYFGGCPASVPAIPVHFYNGAGLMPLLPELTLSDWVDRDFREAALSLTGLAMWLKGKTTRKRQAKGSDK